MTAIGDLTTAYTTEIAKISDTLVKAEATYCAERLVAAMAKQASLEANEIQSYSIAGRTITRRDTSAGLDLINSLRHELYGYNRGHVSLVDLNNNGVTI